MSAGASTQRLDAPAAAAPAGPVPADDWCLLFTAVCDRLLDAAAAAPPGDPLARMVQDAVQALRSLVPPPAPPAAVDLVCREGGRCCNP